MHSKLCHYPIILYVFGEWPLKLSGIAMLAIILSTLVRSNNLYDFSQLFLDFSPKNLELVKRLSLFFNQVQITISRIVINKCDEIKISTQGCRIRSTYIGVNDLQQVRTSDCSFLSYLGHFTSTTVYACL